MNIVNFTPLSAFTGGAIIGFAVFLFFLFNGRMIGVSGIASSFLISKNQKIDNFLFLIGLILGPLFYSFVTNQKIEISITNSLLLIIIAGLLVGFGTKISGGCTSGHAISGISRFSLRSIIATITFMVIGIVTVTVKNFI